MAEKAQVHSPGRGKPAKDRGGNDTHPRRRRRILTPTPSVLSALRLAEALLLAGIASANPTVHTLTTAAAGPHPTDDSLAMSEPNPPPWPDTVHVITPDMTPDDIRSVVGPIEDPPQIWTDVDDPDKPERSGHNSDRHFVDDRRAVLFAPGAYSVDFEVGYYVQVAGLGARADDVVFTDCDRGPYVEALNKHRIVGDRPGLSLDTFWRVAENYSTEARGGQMWAASQASPLRRVRVGGDLTLHDRGAYASGGHLANAAVGGRVDFGSQQQFLCRSVDLAESASRDGPGAVCQWSTVFVDCVNPPPARDGRDGGPSVTVHDPAVTVEKPFVALRDDGTYELRVPRPRRRREEEGPLGSDLVGSDDEVRDFSGVRVAVATMKDGAGGKDVADPNVAKKINAALAEGKDVVLSPGIYHLEEPLQVTRDNQVILGLGLATLVAPEDGWPCIEVAGKLSGVRIAGIMLEASEIVRAVDVATLLEWGNEGTSDADPGDPSNPGVLTDIFARVGGSSLNRNVSTDVMVRIHSGNVVGDNLWLWRADHVKLRPGEEENFPPLDYHQVTAGECPVGTGIEVNGHDVTIHGLAVEHTTEHQTVWNGERGSVQFYQCELPYDVGPEFGRRGYLGYKVHRDVESHDVGGIGVYSNFRDHDVKVPTAIRHPKPEQVVNPFALKLDNIGTIQSVVNGEGEPASEQGTPVRI